MVRYLILTSWIQNNRYNGIEEYYNIVRDASNTINDVELFGLYRPITEKWHWAYLIYTDDLEKWEDVEETIERNYLKKRDEITQKTTRIYIERVRNPKPKKLELLKYLEVELSVWEGIDKGVRQYFDTISEVFLENEDAWLMGQYYTASEKYNWAHIFMYKSLNDMIEMDFEFYKAMGRPPNQLFFVERLYKLYDLAKIDKK